MVILAQGFSFHCSTDGTCNVVRLQLESSLGQVMIGLIEATQLLERLNEDAYQNWARRYFLNLSHNSSDNTPNGHSSFQDTASAGFFLSLGKCTDRFETQEHYWTRFLLCRVWLLLRRTYRGLNGTSWGLPRSPARYCPAFPEIDSCLTLTNLLARSIMVRFTPSCPAGIWLYKERSDQCSLEGLVII